MKLFSFPLLIHQLHFSIVHIEERQKERNTKRGGFIDFAHQRQADTHREKEGEREIHF